ncbi:hypothetical protein GmHk_07G019547 [Glycine max]|nr:hypothetical protein GmHk_07G019547 [Glycine max]
MEGARKRELSISSRKWGTGRVGGHRNGLLSLYKDMESCGEYADIQVMWKMIESSSPQYACCHKKRINRSSYWVVCFRPT